MSEFDRVTLQKEVEKEKKKKSLLIGMGVCIVIIVLLTFFVMYYKRVDATTFKLYINGQQAKCSSDFYIKDKNGKIYIKAKELASLTGWTYQNGEYGSFTEDTNSGYFQNDYEVASFSVGSNTLKKYIQVSNSILNKDDDDKDSETITFTAANPNGTLESSKLSLPIISSNNQVYIPLESVPDICCSKITFDNNKMIIYDQAYLISLAQTVAAENGYTTLSGVYENIRALAYGMCVVEKDGVYGVVTLNNAEQVLGFKYSDILFQQNVKEFFVKATGNDGGETVGVVDFTGSSIISPKSYEKISILSDELGLYVVEKNNRYGVLDRQGDIIVHAEYDSIGLSETEIDKFILTSEDNTYMLFDNTIIVEKDAKWGLFNLEGKCVLDPVYIALGYNIVNDVNAVKDSENVLTIEGKDIEMSDGTTRTVQAIVIQYKGNTEENIYYGLYDAVSEKLIVPCVCDRIYSITKNGETLYYMEYNGNLYEFVSYMAANPGIF